MKIAVFGDLHGNIEALKAAYQAAPSAKAERIYRLSDLGGYAPFVNDVVVEFLIDKTADKVNVEFVDARRVDKTTDAIVASGLPSYVAFRLKEAR